MGAGGCLRLRIRGARNVVVCGAGRRPCLHRRRLHPPASRAPRRDRSAWRPCHLSAARVQGRYLSHATCAARCAAPPAGGPSRQPHMRASTPPKRLAGRCLMPSARYCPGHACTWRLLHINSVASGASDLPGSRRGAVQHCVAATSSQAGRQRLRCRSDRTRVAGAAPHSQDRGLQRAADAPHLLPIAPSPHTSRRCLPACPRASQPTLAGPFPALASRPINRDQAIATYASP